MTAACRRHADGAATVFPLIADEQDLNRLRKRYNKRKRALSSSSTDLVNDASAAEAVKPASNSLTLSTNDPLNAGHMSVPAGAAVLLVVVVTVVMPRAV